MTIEPAQSAEHAQFDTMCDGLEDYDTLPLLTPSPAPTDRPDYGEERSKELDERILAALVSPY
jgi:hypothetical protein